MGKIDYRFKKEIFSQQNPFLNVAQRINQLKRQNFIVEWQMGGSDKKEVSGEKVYETII
jgi:hypothetical protein